MDLADNDILAEGEGIRLSRSGADGVEPGAALRCGPPPQAPRDPLPVEHEQSVRGVDEDLLPIQGPESEFPFGQNEQAPGLQGMGGQDMGSLGVGIDRDDQSARPGRLRAGIDQFDPEIGHRRGRHFVEANGSAFRWCWFPKQGVEFEAEDNVAAGGRLLVDRDRDPVEARFRGFRRDGKIGRPGGFRTRPGHGGGGDCAVRHVGPVDFLTVQVEDGPVVQQVAKVEGAEPRGLGCSEGELGFEIVADHVGIVATRPSQFGPDRFGKPRFETEDARSGFPTADPGRMGGGGPVRRRCQAGLVETPGCVPGDEGDPVVRGRTVRIGKVYRPRGAVHLDRSGPVFGGLVGGVGIALGQGRPGAVCRRRPAAVVPVFEGVHQAAGLVDQGDPLSLVVEVSGERAELSRGGRLGNDEVSAGVEEGLVREGEIDAAPEPPAGEVDHDSHLVEEFDPFAVFGWTGRVVLHLVEDHHAVR